MYFNRRRGREMKRTHKFAKRLVVVCLCLLLTPALFAAGPKAGGKAFRVGVSLSNFSNPVIQVIMNGIKERGNYYGLDMIILDGKEDTVEQTAHLDNFIQQKVDLIILNPSMPDPMLPAIQRVNKAGIPLVVLDKMVWKRGTNVTWAALVDWDMPYSGVIGADQVAKAVNNNGKVVVVEGTPGTSSFIDRAGGFYTQLKKYPNVKVLDKVQGNFLRDKGMEVTQDILAKYPKGSFDVIYYMSDEMALGGLQAIKSSGRLGEFEIVSVDGNHEIIDAMKRGEVDYECMFFPEQEAVCVDVAWDILNGTFKKSRQYEWKGREIPWSTDDHEGLPWVRATCYWVDKSNMNEPDFKGF
jgi:ABC-type sugar transport system substrate-binding protein